MKLVVALADSSAMLPPSWRRLRLARRSRSRRSRPRSAAASANDVPSNSCTLSNRRATTSKVVNVHAQAMIEKAKADRLAHLEAQSLEALTLAADNFERAVFPNAMIVGDCVITHLLGKLGYLESGKVKVMVVDTFHLFDSTMPFLADLEEEREREKAHDIQVQGRDLRAGRLREQGCLPQEVRRQALGRGRRAVRQDLQSGALPARVCQDAQYRCDDQREASGPRRGARLH